MNHIVDGFEMKFTNPSSWKAERRQGGKLIDVVPVTWTKGWRQEAGNKGVLLEIWYQERLEMQRRRTNPAPFVVALASAKDYAQFPYQFEAFRGVYEVAATGQQLSPNSLEARVIRRIRG